MSALGGTQAINIAVPKADHDWLVIAYHGSYYAILLVFLFFIFIILLGLNFVMYYSAKKLKAAVPAGTSVAAATAMGTASVN